MLPRPSFGVSSSCGDVVTQLTIFDKSFVDE